MGDLFIPDNKKSSKSGKNKSKNKTESNKKSKSDEWFIPDDIRDQIIERFKSLKEQVTLELFIKEGENDPYNAFATFFCIDLSRLSDKIKLNINTIGDNKSDKMGIKKSPSILINPGEYNIRFKGAPAGEESRAFIQAIIMVSNKDSGMGEESKKKLAELTEERHIQIFVTPGCPYCPDQVLNAFRAAIERPDLIKAECIESTQNIELSRKHNIGSVPHTIINGKTISIGLEPEQKFIEEVLSLEPTEEMIEILEDEDISAVDLIIVGGGPAGLSAGIYAQRSGLKSILIEKDILGGQVSLTPVVENYPGFTNVGGKKLMEIMSAHAKNYIHIHEGEEILEIKIGKMIEALTNKKRYRAKGLIIATGAKYKKLDVIGEEKYSGLGVSYCATCDGFLFKDKEVIVVGGGNSAMTDALFLKSLGAKVTIIHRRNTLRAQQYLQDSINREEIPIIWDSIVEKIQGDGVKITNVILKDLKTGETKGFQTDAVFIAIGEIPNSNLAADIGIKLKDNGFIEVDNSCRTNIPRIYAAGDVTGGIRQIVTAVSEGSIAALSAFSDIVNPYWKKDI